MELTSLLNKGNSGFWKQENSLGLVIYLLCCIILYKDSFSYLHWNTVKQLFNFEYTDFYKIWNTHIIFYKLLFYIHNQTALLLISRWTTVRERTLIWKWVMDVLCFISRDKYLFIVVLDSEDGMRRKFSASSWCCHFSFVQHLYFANMEFEFLSLYILKSHYYWRFFLLRSTHSKEM